MDISPVTPFFVEKKSREFLQSRKKESFIYKLVCFSDLNP
jgi:hypothetical protein